MRLFTATLIFVLGLVANAGAVTWAEDYELANRYWGGPPPLCTTVTIAALVPTSSTEDGWATIPEAPEPCLLLLREGMDPYTECYTIMHEDGHLHGLEHSTDPRSIMYPEIPNNESHIWLCEHQYKVLLRQHKAEHHGKKT